jgi:hypothetical protein
MSCTPRSLVHDAFTLRTVGLAVAEMGWLDDSDARTEFVYWPVLRPRSRPTNLAQRIIHFCNVYAGFLDTAEYATVCTLVPLLSNLSMGYFLYCTSRDEARFRI